MTGINNEGVNAARDVEDAVNSWVDLRRGFNSTQEMVQIGVGRNVDKLALESSGPPSTVAQYLLGSSKLKSSTVGSMADAGVSVKDPDTTDSSDNPDTHFYYPSPAPNILQSEVDPWIDVEGSSKQTLDFVQQLSGNVAVDNSDVIEPLASKESIGIIPLSELVYVGVSSKALDLDTFELPGYSTHGFFDGSTLKLSRRFKREARPGGSARRILSQSDLDQYCTGL